MSNFSFFSTPLASVPAHPCPWPSRFSAPRSAFSSFRSAFPSLHPMFPVPLVPPFPSLLPSFCPFFPCFRSPSSSFLFRGVCARRFSRRGPAPFLPFPCLLSRALNNKMVSCLDSCHLNLRNCIFLQKSSENILPVRKKSVPLHSLSGKNPGCTQKNEFFERLRTSKQGSNAARVPVSGDEICGS